jgi:hypothetical protein
MRIKLVKPWYKCQRNKTYLYIFKIYSTIAKWGIRITSQSKSFVSGRNEIFKGGGWNVKPRNLIKQ